MKSFFGKQDVKDNVLARINAHNAADELVRGETWDGKRGRAIGCSLNAYDHKAFESELGLPEWLAILEDTLFENMSVEKSKTWPRDVIEAIKPGAKIEKVKWQFCAFILNENIDRALSLKISDELKDQVVKAIRQVLSVHNNAIETGNWDASAARSAAKSAWSAAWSAESAAWSAESGARSAAWSAESAAWSAARSAAWSAAKSARSATVDCYADKLLELLREAK